MSLLETQKPYLPGGVRSINFYNGRLLSGEDLSGEQAANTEWRSRLGAAIGVGVATGLEVQLPQYPDSLSTPVVEIAKGTAINMQGQVLTLTDNITLSLAAALRLETPPADAANQSTFNSVQSSLQLDESAWVESGVYLLTIAPITVREGYSPIIGFGSGPHSTSTRFQVDTVQFRLFQLSLSSGLINDPNYLRNTLAYACFGLSNESPGAQSDNPLEVLAGSLTSDIPLALISWDGAGNIDFIDSWAVRRRLARPAFSAFWDNVLGDQRLAEREAMFLQFQDHIVDLQQALDDPGSLGVGQVFRFLPAAGYLPVGDAGFDWQRFLGLLAPPRITCVDAALMRLLLQQSFFEEPIKVGPYADGSASNELMLDVYQDSARPDIVLFARSTTGRMLFTVSAQGYQPAGVMVSMAIGQQTSLSLQLQPKTVSADQQPLRIEIEEIARPALHKIRLSLVAHPGSYMLPDSVIKVDFAPLPADVRIWLQSWQKWLQERYPDKNVDCNDPTLYIDDYYAPPKGKVIPERPQALALFGDLVVPLLLTISYYTTPLPVPLARAGIRGLTQDVIEQLAGVGIYTVDQVVAAWSQLISNATGRSLEYSRLLIADAAHAIDRLYESRRYYEGMDSEIKEVLEQMALSDDVALANADLDELAEKLDSRGFALRLITQAWQAVPAEHWSLASFQFSDQQVQALAEMGITSKGEFAKRADSNAGNAALQKALGVNKQTIESYQVNAYQQMTASSKAMARFKDMILLPNVNAEVASQLAAANITEVEQLAHLEKATLMQITGMSEDAAEDLLKEAKGASADALEIVKLASVTKDVAEALNDVLGVQTVEHLNREGEEKVEQVFRRFHGDRAAHFVRALFNGIRGSER